MIHYHQAHLSPNTCCVAGYRLGSHVEDEHQMVEPEQYRGIPGSGAAEAQPFRIEVTPTAQVLATIMQQ